MKRTVACGLLLGLAMLSGGLVACSASNVGSAGGEKPTDAKASVATPNKVRPVAMPALAATKPVDYPGIHNAVTYVDGYISGSMPEGDAGFDTLAGMGIRTIISVDGAEPEVSRAEARGIRYIHLPIGYNGFDDARRLELVRATRDALAQGPVYIHCHHGKHRSAGAAASVAVALGLANPQSMLERMKVSGTAAGYTGLWACARNATVLSKQAIDAVPGTFASVSKPSGFVQAMVDMDVVMEHLTAIEKAGWKVPADHPDLVPAAEAGRLADLLRNSAEGGRAKSQPAEFAELLRRNAREAQAIEDMLAAGQKDVAKLSAGLKLVAATCKDCHVTYRDVP
jgi:protein tyrosine phosphatase (PTP) superfamily phosphohydrolase (DUF442 family)